MRVIKCIACALHAKWPQQMLAIVFIIDHFKILSTYTVFHSNGSSSNCDSTMSKKMK